MGVKYLNTEPCPICGVIVKLKSDVQRHLDTHDAIKRRQYPCEFPGCDYATSQKSNLKSHRNKHTKEKPFKCMFCLEEPTPVEKCYADAASLSRHEKNAHGRSRQAEKRKAKKGQEANTKAERRHHPYERHRSASISSSSDSSAASSSSSFPSSRFSSPAACSGMSDADIHQFLHGVAYLQVSSEYQPAAYQPTKESDHSDTQPESQHTGTAAQTVTPQVHIYLHHAVFSETETEAISATAPTRPPTPPPAYIWTPPPSVDVQTPVSYSEYSAWSEQQCVQEPVPLAELYPYHPSSDMIPEEWVQPAAQFLPQAQLPYSTWDSTWNSTRDSTWDISGFETSSLDFYTGDFFGVAVQT